MNIYVKNKDFGFLTEVEIPVVRYEYSDELKTPVWCNHAGAEEEQVENTLFNPNGADWVTYDTVWYCRRCGAYKHDGMDWENELINLPDIELLWSFDEGFEGKHLDDSRINDIKSDGVFDERPF